MVLSELSNSQMTWSQSTEFLDSICSVPAARRIYEALDAVVLEFAATIRTPRKGYTAWARSFQFAAAKPTKGGVNLGLAVGIELDSGLLARGNASWSQRLQSRLLLPFGAKADQRLAKLLHLA